MNRRVTWLVVGAVAAVGLAAAVDALRGESEAAPPLETSPATTDERAPAGSNARNRLEDEPPPLPHQERVRAVLEDAGATGALYVSDLNCRLRAFRLPTLEWLAEPAAVEGPCRFTINANGELFPDGTTFERAGEIGAHCRGNTVDVFNSPSGIGLRQVVGCAPAWKPDGSLTVLRDGRLVQVTGLDQQRVLLSRDIVRALGPEARLRSVAWIDNASFGTVVRRGGRYQLAVFDGKRLVGPPSFSSPRIEGLRTGGSGLLAAETGTPQAAVSFFDRRGRLLLSVGGREFSWEPGGTVAAVAGRLEILFVAPLTGDVVPLSLVASDLEWR
jgi:hypothetical protein